MRDLASQWRTQDGKERAEEIFGRLLAGSRLDDLRLGEHDGRVDLRGIGAPPPERLKTLEKNGWVIAQLGGLLKFESVKLADLDFSGGLLEGFRFFNTTINNCRFDGARCHDWRLWAVDVTDTGFVGIVCTGSGAQSGPGAHRRTDSHSKSASAFAEDQTSPEFVPLRIWHHAFMLKSTNYDGRCYAKMVSEALDLV
jgi:hypothetical protein